MCANCGGPLNIGSGYATSSDGELSFCPDCAGIAEALGIGARLPAFLYDDGRGNAISWTGTVLGAIIHMSTPQRRRLGAARYRVRMLDKSLWWGTGPTANGNYIRLRPMKGE